MWVWRVTENSILKTLRNSILTDEISENTWNEELNKLFLVKIQIRENYTRLSITRNEESQNMHCSIATRAWISKTTNIESQSMGRSSSTWENTFVWRIEDEEPSSSRNASQEGCQEFEELKRCCYQEENTEKQRLLEEFLMQHDQESRIVSLLGDQVRNLQERLEIIEDLKSYMTLTHRAVVTYLRSSTSSYSKHTRKKEVFLETFLIVNMLDETLMNFTNDSINLATLLGTLRTEGIEKWKRRTIAVNTFILFLGKSKTESLNGGKCPVFMTGPCRGYLDLYSRHDNSELSLLGGASAKIPRPNEISELDREFPSRSLRKGS